MALRSPNFQERNFNENPVNTLKIDPWKLVQIDVWTEFILILRVRTRFLTCFSVLVKYYHFFTKHDHCDQITYNFELQLGLK